ncbi:SDR family oxidoreductase [Marinobacter gelidimuriae]|uniref:SDR family oxidoreductase n=1 Tax=Marinobacter gelidimuriae TaxID=2739064 RepID=UPI0003827F47|nr:SDR family oxidoreductase [Marinobacter gelidimuriae]
MTILVTGATGFIGRYVLAALTGRGLQVFALMRSQAKLADLRQQVDHLGGRGALVEAVAGDLDRQAGAYEASKLEGALRVRAFAEQNALAMVEVQPATVSGHSVTGELDTAQPLYALIENLVAGRLAMVPGTPDHWLPLVSVDVLAGLIAEASLVESVPDRLLALDRTTPNLIGLLSLLAVHLEARPPKHHMPMAAVWVRFSIMAVRVVCLPSHLNEHRPTAGFIPELKRYFNG